ncbi:energy transducer TonB [Parasphingopyxis algicola]|uniref:energy transducer TonB n=1 Tax=Parasphingopyxis algicola TaxID=2026624 RepID=UPI0015A11BDB|nr:energy transducer TonB [Parasphingopyxis algicola]QLC24249.1 energy transducer TonB [Parasphingopyxis algicola]
MKNFSIGMAIALAANSAWTSPALAQAEPSPAMPLGNPGSWITTADYPPMALRLEEEGIASFRLRIGVDGKVKECTITSSTGSELLDEQTCGALTFRARFRPARDADGNPTEGSYSSSVRWEIPSRSGGGNEDLSLSMRPSANLAEFVVDFAADGTVAGCELIAVEPANGLAETIQNQFCQQYEYSGFQVTPYTDDDGNPVSRRARIRFSTTIEEIPESEAGQ